MKKLFAFFSVVYGSIALICAIVVLWQGVDFSSKRIAIVVLVGWILLVPYAFEYYTRSEGKK